MREGLFSFNLGLLSSPSLVLGEGAGGWGLEYRIHTNSLSLFWRIFVFGGAFVYNLVWVEKLREIASHPAGLIKHRISV